MPISSEDHTLVGFFSMKADARWGLCPVLGADVLCELWGVPFWREYLRRARTCARYFYGGFIRMGFYLLPQCP